MDRNRVTVRYAKALVELASEQNILPQISNDAGVMLASLTDFEGFSQYILNPGFSSSEKYQKVESIFSKDFHELTMKFYQMVFNNNREEYLKDLCRNIVEMSRQIAGLVTANLETAKTLDKTLIEKLKVKFEKELNITLEMTTEVTPEIIGGFIFTIDGKQYDASVSSQISAIKKQLQLK